MRTYGLIGQSLKHSFSADYFNSKFQREGMTDYCYELFELESIESLSRLIEEHPDLEGFNVTIPYKEQILPYLYFRDKVVDEIGACNCVKIINDKLYGYNTDVEGFLKSFIPLFQTYHHSALILGNGGAAKAVKAALDELSIQSTMVARKPNSVDEILWDTLSAGTIEDNNIIVNATPLGMYPDVNSFPPIPYKAITRFHLVIDLVYNPAKTIFLQKAEAQDAILQNGIEMLEQQAEASWNIWSPAI